MKKIRLGLVIVMVCLQLNILYSQNNYFATDSALTTGIELIRGTSVDNAQFIRLTKNKQEIKYTPEELKEYGFKDGTVYVSKNISVLGQTKTVFLERLQSGKITLYYYKERGFNTFFLERDSTVFIELSRNDIDFKKRISDNTMDANWGAGQIQLVEYNRKSLSKLIAMYNQFDNRPFPYRRFGIIAGYSRTSLIVPSGISNEFLADISFTPGSSVLFGVFADIPIEMSYFSLNTGVNFTKNGFSVNSVNDHSDRDVLVNLTSINVPVLLRYTLPTLTWRPFVNFGGFFTYHLTNKGQIFIASIEQDVITIDEVMTGRLIDDSMLGYSFGLGLQHHLSYRKNIAIELRFNQLLGNNDKLHKNQLEILTSFSF